MDVYQLLVLAHIVGFILLGGGLLAVFVSELRAYQTTDIHVFAEAARYTAFFYDSLVTSGAIVVGVSGLLLVFETGLGFFEEPWLVGMWGLFLFEFIEGNTITRRQFRRTLRRSQDALAQGAPLTDELRADARGLVSQVTHFLDIPLFSVIVYCGALRPDAWAPILTAVGLALAAAVSLTFLVPRMARRGTRETEQPATQA